MLNMPKSPTVSLVSAKGLFRQVSESSHELLDRQISNPLGNGYHAHHSYFGRVLVLTTGPNKGVWREVTQVGSMALPVSHEPFKAPSKRPTYHDHM